MPLEVYAWDVVRSVLEPFTFFARADKRVHWLFLSSALGLAALVGLSRRRSLRSLLAWLFPKRLFLHRSSLLDLKLVLAKSVIFAALFAPRLVPTALVTALVATLLRAALDAPSAATWTDAEIACAYTLGAFVVDDLSRYLFHRAFHRIPALWELHKVHHSADVLTPLTLYRTHPIEGALYQLRGVVAVGLVSGVLFFFFGERLNGWDVLGVEAIGFAFNLAGANLRHSHVWLSFGRWLEHLFISPAQHQIHHSRAAEHHDRNFGSFLAIWDWLGGSLVLAGHARPRLRFGLSAEERNHEDSLLSVLVAPTVAAYRVLRPRSGHAESSKDATSAARTPLG